MTAESRLSGLRALVVEDEILLAEELRDRLFRLGMREVRLVDTGECAVEASTRYRPHIILMDIRLKGPMDGIEAAAAIRGRVEAPVVFLTAHSDQDTLHRAMQSEPFGYVLKPLNERELVVAIEMSLRRFELESRLRESENRFAATLASIGDGVIATDLNGHVTFMNTVAEQLTGWQRNQAHGRAAGEVMQIVAEATGERCEPPIERALQVRETVQLDEPTLLVTRDGDRIPIDDSAAPVIGAQGEMMGAVVAFRDIRKRRLTEKALEEATAQLRQAQKLEAIGRMAGGIAHDFNNFLTVINGSADMALDEMGLDASTRQLLGVIQDTGRRAAVLTRQLLTFGRRDHLQIVTVRLDELLDQAAKLLGHMLPPIVELEVTVDADLWPVRGDPAKIEQVIMNLGINARDAMPDGGRLRLSLENVDIGAADVAMVPGIQPGPFVVLTIADSGCGMEPEVRQHIFEPFFTTKAPGRGTGLGLATVYGIVGQLNAFITVASESGQGSTFRVYLPGQPQMTTADPDLETRRTETSRFGGHENVLLVDDDEAIRSLIVVILEREGYTVVPAANGEEALRAIARSARPFDLMMTDLVLSGMDGHTLVEVARAVAPAMKVLYVSAIEGTEATPGGATGSDVPLLRKPFMVHALLAEVRHALDG